MSEQLEHIAHIVHEQGYWKPNGHVQNYRLQEVYRLGKSAQRLFDAYAIVDQRTQQLHAWLGHIKQRLQMEAEAPPQEVFAGLAAAMDTAEVQGEINAIVKLLEQPTHPGWFRWLFGHGRGKREASNVLSNSFMELSFVPSNLPENRIQKYKP